MDTVFHLSSDDNQKKSELFGNIQNLIDDDKAEVDKISVVVNSNAIVVALENSESSDLVREFLERGVEFNICSNSVENAGVPEEKLIEGLNLVSSGVGKLNKLQEQGYNYIRI